jgi:hypothetical protein
VGVASTTPCLLRCGAASRVLGHLVMAPSTIGTFLRAFTFGHVRQLDRLGEQLLGRPWAAGAGPGDGPMTIDLDSTLCQVHGHHKQGAPYGDTHTLGDHSLRPRRRPGPPAAHYPRQPAERTRIIEAFRSERAVEYAEVLKRTPAFLDEMASERARGRATYAEVEESEADLERFQSWLAKIAARDYFDAPNAAQARAAVERCAQALAAFEQEALDAEAPNPSPATEPTPRLRVAEPGA